MKTIFLTALLLTLPFNGAFADNFAETSNNAETYAQVQDEETVINEVLAQLPAETASDFDALMQELASLGRTGVEILAGRLVPAAEGQNATIEYALNGLVAYVSADEREALAEEVRSGLRSAIDLCTDKVNQGFLMTLLQLIAGAEDVPTFVKYINDEDLKPFAINGLITIQDDGKEVSKLLRKSKVYDEGLAYLAKKKGLAYPKNSPVKTEGVAEGLKLLKSKNSHERVNGLCIMMACGDIAPQELVIEALLEDDREYRAAALMLANDFADEAFYAEVATLIPEFDDETKADVINWYGDNHVTSQSGPVVRATTSHNPELAKTAIKAAGKIGGDEALKALETCLDGPFGKDAVVALASFGADVTEVAMRALEGSSEVQILGLELAAARHITASTPKVFELTEAEDGELSKAAYKALAGVCTTNDFERLRSLLDTCDEEDAPAVRAAMVVSVQGLPSEAVAALTEEALAGSETAFFALVNMRANVTDDLLALAELDNEQWRDDALLRVCVLMDEYVPRTERADIIIKALDLQPSVKVQKELLTALGDSYDPSGIYVALVYIDKDETAESAAYAIKTIAGKNPSLLTNENMRAALLKARDVYSARSLIYADDGYAVKEIDGMLSK